MVKKDRSVWENQVDLLNDLWEARAERDRWRKAADEIERLRAARNPKAVDDLYAMMVDWRSKALEAKAVAENYKKEVIRLANKIKEMNND
jgi:hypothetical protein